MTTVLAIIVIALIVLAFVFAHARQGRREGSSLARPPQSPSTPQQASNAPWPYIRGTDLYRRSLDADRVAPFARQAQGLPLYHDESQWRDPPG